MKDEKEEVGWWNDIEGEREKVIEKRKLVKEWK